MQPILAGFETEYGIAVEGRGAEEQVEDAIHFVRGCARACDVAWDYRFESPRRDLRGFQLERLARDPTDQRFERALPDLSDVDIRADRLLPNGARFYNDHGHPEYATPECWSARELAMHDLAGEVVLLEAAAAFREETGRAVTVYKNNTDYHGASYGTHENYLVPRSISPERLIAGLTPMLVCRQVLTGAGKVGAETGKSVDFQLSQRADFFMEPANAETLYRRPIFNTRDEPHADPTKWLRAHVITGDANMMPAAAARKVSLVKLALALTIEGAAPEFTFSDPVAAFKAISRDSTRRFEAPLRGGSWTTVYDVLESYFAAGEAVLGLRPAPSAESDCPEDELGFAIHECRQMLAELREHPERLAASVDWAAKRSMLDEVIAAEGGSWTAPMIASLDLAYHDIDPESGLYFALVADGRAPERPDREDLEQRLKAVFEPTRARARSLALRRFSANVESVSWGCVTFQVDGRRQDVRLDPERAYDAQRLSEGSVGEFIAALGGAV